MIAQIIGWFVFLALTKNFPHAHSKATSKSDEVYKGQTAFVGSCAEITRTPSYYPYNLNSGDAYWFWMKDARYNEANKCFDATIIYSTNNAKRPVSPDFQERVKRIQPGPSSGNGASHTKQFIILICNLTKNDTGNYSVRYINQPDPKQKWKTPDVNLTVIDNPCPITFVQKPSIVKESDEIELTCSTLSSCPSKLQIQESTQSSAELRNTDKMKSIVYSWTATWQDDGKIYSCQTQDNKDPYLIQNITLNVEFAPKETVAEIPANINEGQSVTLTCSAKGRPDPSFTWVRIYPNYTESAHSAAQWQITNIQDSQSGKYLCVAENKHGTKSTSLTIDVKYAPQVEVKMTPDASEVREGEEITLTCNVKRSNPLPHSFLWKKDQRDIVWKKQYVKVINPEDEGSYTCTATNSVGRTTSEPHKIIVHYTPRKTNISTSTTDNTIKVGGSITFTCETDANPQPLKYSWYRFNENEQAIPQWNSSIINKWILNNVQRTDEAWYMCNATNTIGTGQNSRQLHLKVRYGPTNFVLSMDTEVTEGQLINITCTVESYPRSELQLTTPTLDLRPSIYKKPNLLRYTFVVTSAHMGLYACSAHNGDGSGKSTEKKLVVKYHPKDVKVQVDPDLTVNENTSLTLHCKANSYPNATSFTWMKMTDGKNEPMQSTQETIKIKSVKPSDRGQYSCEARNEMGTGGSEKVEIKVKYAPKHTHIIKEAEQLDSQGESFVTLSCNSESYPEIKEYSWYKKDDKTDEMREVSKRKTFTVYSNNPGVYYCIAKNEIYQKKSDPINLFDRSYLTVLKFFFLALIILLIVFSLFFVYRHKRNKAVQQRPTNTPYFDFLDWWNSSWLSLRNNPITSEPSRSRDDLLPDQPCRPNAQRRKPQPDSTPASNIDTVYSTVNLPTGDTGPSAQKPVRWQGGNTEDDSLNYASINFTNKQKKKGTKAKVEDVYAMVSKTKPFKKNEQEKHEDYENISAIHPDKSPDPFNFDTDISEDEVELNYSKVSFKAKPGHQRSNRDSSTSDEEEIQYTDVKI